VKLTADSTKVTIKLQIAALFLSLSLSLFIASLTLAKRHLACRSENKNRFRSHVALMITFKYPMTTALFF
jgi:hypothetical protein